VVAEKGCLPDEVDRSPIAANYSPTPRLYFADLLRDFPSEVLGQYALRKACEWQSASVKIENILESNNFIPKSSKVVFRRNG
jgi:hypothetical protein